MGDKRGSEISYRSLSAELAPTGCKRELNLQSLLETFSLHMAIGLLSTFILSFSNFIWIVVH